jgi:glutamate synthase domain-containing protein 3
MSGGIAYVLDEAGDFSSKVNPLSDVDLDPLGEEDVAYLQKMLRKHFDFTRSKRADDILRKWDTYAAKFVKVFPREYRAALEKMGQHKA